MMRPAIGSVAAGLSGRKRLPTIRVFGTRFVSTTRIHGVHFIAAKYSAAAFTSSSVMAFARSIIVLVFGFRGSAVCRRPFRKSWIWRTKYATGSPAGGAFSGRPFPFGR